MFLLPAFYYSSCVSVNGAAYASGGGQIVNISWNWGDGSTTSGFFPMTHNYTSAGVYNLTVTATESGGGTASATQELTVQDTPWPEPSSTLTLYPSESNGLQVTIDGLADSNDCGPVRDADSGGFLWDWGDGVQTRSFFPATHDYSAPGEYEVCVTILDTFNVSTKQCEAVLAGVSQVPIQIWANQSSAVPTAPMLGQQFVESLAMRDTGSAQATPPESLTIATATPLAGQTPILNCTSEDDFPALQPAETVSVPYACVASWSFTTPGVSLSDAFANYSTVASDVAQNVSSAGVLGYAASVLSGSRLTAFDVGWNTSWESVPGLANESEGIGGIINLSAAGDFVLGVNYGMTLPLDPAYAVSLPAGPVNVEVVATSTNIVEGAGWLDSADSLPSLANGVTAAAISTVTGCGTTDTCAPSASLVGLALLASSIGTSFNSRLLSDPNLDFTSLVTVPSEPTILVNLSAPTAPLLTDEFTVFQNLNASVLSVARGYAAIEAHAYYYAELQFANAEALSANASSAVLSLQQNATLLTAVLDGNNRSNFENGLSLLNSTGIPTNLSALLSAIGVLRYFNLSQATTIPYANVTTPEIALTTPNLGENISAAMSLELQSLETSTTMTTNDTIQDGTAQFDDSTITGVSVSVDSPSTGTGTRVTLDSKQIDSKPRGTGFLPVSNPLGFFDVDLNGLSSGTASVCLLSAGISSSTTITYWNGSVWVTNPATSVNGLSSCAPFSVSQLHGTPLVIGGSAASYTVTFKESGLPPGASWSVDLGTPAFAESNTTSSEGGRVLFDSLAGTQTLAIHSPTGYGVARIVGAGNPSLTAVNVSSNALITVFFGVNETVRFLESTSPQFQLYPGATWSVQLMPALAHGGPAPETWVTDTRAVNFTLPSSGKYRVTVSAPDEYKVLSAGGLLTIPKHSVTLNVRFKLNTETVMFREVGLPSRGTWTVTISSGSTPSLVFPISETVLAGRTISFQLPIGTYTYTVTSAQGGKFTPSSGSFSVLSAPSPKQVISVTYSR